MLLPTWPLRSLARGLLLILAVVLLSGCPGRREPGGEQKLEFWHTRAGEQQKALDALVQEFNATSGGKPIVPVYIRDYGDVRTKVRAGIQAKRLPLLSVCYESQVQEYAGAGVIRSLDSLVAQPETGLSAAELADFYPQFLETNRFKKFNNELLSFPFTKSLLLMAYNQDLMKRAGFQSPPETWTEFQQQARAARKATGQTPYPLLVDASTVDGMIFSFGGDVIDRDGKTLFDQEPTIKTLTLIRDLAREKLATETPARNIAGLFGGGNVLFTLGTSSQRENMSEQAGDKFDWDVRIIPQAPGVKPITVMYGPNICVFKSTTENENLGWKFIKYFTSPAITARWSRETGYLPVRKSAAELPEMKEFFKEEPRALHAFEILPLSKIEPNLPGWDEVRVLLEDANRKAMHNQGTPEEIARELKRKADEALARAR